MRRRTVQATLIALLVLGGGATGLQPSPSLAHDVELTTCSWEAFSGALDAIQTAGGGTLVLDCSGTIIFEDQIPISTAVAIIGNGEIIFDGNGNTRHFEVDVGARLELIGVTLQNGISEYGGAIYNDGTLKVTASAFNDNHPSAFWGQGGAIYNLGSLEVIASSFSGNRAYLGGAIFSYGSLEVAASTFRNNRAVTGGAIHTAVGWPEITASTFTDNYAEFSGGAISNESRFMVITASTFNGNEAGSGGAILNSQPNARLQITSSTLSGNGGIATAGGAIHTRQRSHITEISASIIANNIGYRGPNCDLWAEDTPGIEIISGGWNLTNDSSCGLTLPSDIVTAVNLGALGDNGGPTHTMLPPDGSAAIDNADCGATTDADQRGAPRPDTGCDIGAIEVESTVPPQLIANVTPSGPEGQPVPVVAVGSGPAGSTLSYAFDCAAGGSYAVPGESYAIDETSASYGLASCAFPDDGEYPVGVQICMAEPALCHTAEIVVQVRNVAPEIVNITASGPITQGQIVSISVAATDPAGKHDPLTYAFDCDSDGTYDIESGDSATADCVPDPSQANATITVLVADDDGGSTTGAVTVRQSLPMCANRYTGQLGATLATGSCPPASMPVLLPGDDQATLCIQRYTGELTWSPRGACSPAHTAHVVPDDGPLAYCQNRYTGTLRYTPSGACSPVEREGVIPG